MRPSQSRSNPGDPYLLIVDDEPSVLEVTRSMALSLGWQPLLANTSEHALELFREHAETISHVLLDMHMPGLNGVQLAGAMREIGPHVHIALMTGDETLAERSPAAHAIFDSVLLKPFALDDLDHGFDLQARAA